MGRIRTVKPELRRDLTVAAWPREVRYCWVLLWGYLDDAGRGLADIRLLVADLFPLDRDVTEKKLASWVDLFVTSGCVCRYTVDGQEYLHAIKWDRHQRINRPSPSLIPHCPEHESFTEDSVSPHGARTEPSRKIHGRLSDASLPSRAPAEQGTGNREAGDTRAEPARPDVDKICQALADAVTGNGSKPPTVTARWRTEARLLLDTDRRPLDEVLAVIDWSSKDPFWRTNVLSLPTLREKYDRLRLKRETELRLLPGGQEEVTPW